MLNALLVDFATLATRVFCEAQYEQHTASAKPAVIFSMSSPLELVSVSQKIVYQHACWKHRGQIPGESQRVLQEQPEDIVTLNSFATADGGPFLKNAHVA